jgi:hypothetical protein
MHIYHSQELPNDAGEIYQRLTLLSPHADMDEAIMSKSTVNR